MLKHLLVPLDGSKLAEEAIPYAREIIAPDNRITLVYAVEIPEIINNYYPSLTIDKEGIKNQQIASANHYLAEMAADLKKEGIYTQFEATIGDPANIIKEAAERLGVDAIVMSSHGRSGIGRFLFGSVTNKILETKVCPVFVIPSKASVPVEAPAKVLEPVN